MPAEGTSIIGSSVPDRAVYNSVPRGGPIYVPDIVGPNTRTAEFEALVIEELEGLRAEVHVHSSQVCRDDLSVDELKVLTEEELVEKALKEALKDKVHHESLSQVPEELSKSMWVKNVNFFN